MRPLTPHSSSHPLRLDSTGSGGVRAAAVICCLGVVGLALQGCAVSGPEVTVLPARIDYVCANDRILSVARTADQRTARVLLDGRELVLMRANSAAQEKYSDGDHALYLQGERAMLERDGRVLYGYCVSPVALPTAYQERRS